MHQYPVYAVQSIYRVLMQRANKNTRYTQLNGLESVTQVLQVIVTRQLITQVTLGRGLNR